MRQVALFEEELALPSGIGTMERDEAQIDPAVREAFVEALLAPGSHKSRHHVGAVRRLRCDDAGLGGAGRNRATGGRRFSLLMLASSLVFWPGVDSLASRRLTGPAGWLERGEVMAVREVTTTQAPEAPRDWWVPIDWP